MLMNNTISKNMARDFVAYLTTKSQIALVGSILGFGFIWANSAQAATISLGAADGYAVLGGTAVTNKGASIITGDLGYGTTVTGFPVGSVSGTIRTGADLTAAMIDAQAARAAYIALANLPPGQNLTYAALASLSPNQNLTGLDLARTLNAGVYLFDTTAALTGNLSLDAQNISNARFVFQIGSALNTAAISSVSLLNGADARNVFFLVGSSATLGAGTQFNGNILALAAITVGADSRVNGNTSAGGALTIGADSRVNGNTSAGGALTIGASNQVTGNTSAGGALTIGASSRVTGNTSAGGALTIGASSRVTGNIIARGDISIGASNQVTGNTIARDIAYGASSRVNGNIIASGDIAIGAGSNIECGSVLAGGAVTLDTALPAVMRYSSSNLRTSSSNDEDLSI